MITNEKHGISEAKKAPFKVAFETEAFLASEMTSFSNRWGSFVPAGPGAERFLADRIVNRVAQLPARAVAFGAARLQC